MIVWLEIGLVWLGNIPMSACPCRRQLRIRIGIMKCRRKVGQKVNPRTRRIGRVETYQIMNKSGGCFTYSVQISWSAEGDKRGDWRSYTPGPRGTDICAFAVPMT